MTGQVWVIYTAGIYYIWYLVLCESDYSRSIPCGSRPLQQNCSCRSWHLRLVPPVKHVQQCSTASLRRKLSCPSTEIPIVIESYVTCRVLKSSLPNFSYAKLGQSLYAGIKNRSEFVEGPGECAVLKTSLTLKVRWRGTLKPEPVQSTPNVNVFVAASSRPCAQKLYLDGQIDIRSTFLPK